MEIMGLFVLFFIACVIGWIMEFFYSNLIEKKRKNPGFLKGPYLPIYGFAVLLLHFIIGSEINTNYKIALLILLPTLIELLTGLVFEKYFRIKLWDYSNEFLNYKGIVCLRFFMYWSALALLYYFFLYNFIDGHLSIMLSNITYIFFYGAIAGIFLLDVFYSFHIAFKIKTVAEKLGKKKINFNIFYNAGNIFDSVRGKIKKTIADKIRSEESR